MTGGRPVTHDRGAVLPVVLLVLVLMSIVVVGTARYTSANLRYGTVVRHQVVATAAAEAGARYGIGQARVNSLTTCENGPVELASLALSEIHTRGDLTVTCSRLDPGQPTLAGWAAVVTGEGIGGTTDLLVEDASLVPTKDIATGRIMVESPLQPDFRINFNDALLDGDLFYDGSGDACTTIYEYEANDDNPFDFDDDIEFHDGSFVCWTQPWDDVVAEPPIPPAPFAGLPVDPMPTLDANGCLVFEPGYYTGPSLPLQAGGANYFQSGVYVLYDALVDTENGGSGMTTILGGYPHDATFVNDLVVGTCDAAQAADPLSDGAGVTWYLGGSSKIELNDNPSIELLPRLHTDGVRDHAVSIHVVGASSPMPIPPGPLPPTLDSTLSGSDLVVDSAGGGPDGVQIHGQIWAPEQSVDVRFARANSGNFVTQGIVAAHLRLEATTEAGGWLGPDRTPVEHRLLITSTAEFEGEEAEVQAVIQYRPNAPAGSRVAVESFDVTS